MIAMAMRAAIVNEGVVVNIILVTPEYVATYQPLVQGDLLVLLDPSVVSHVFARIGDLCTFGPVGDIEFAPAPPVSEDPNG